MSGVGGQRQHHVDLVLHRLPRDLEPLRAAELDDAGPLAARLSQQARDEAGRSAGARTRTAAIEKRHRRHDRADERPPHDECRENAEPSRVVFGGKIKGS